MSENLTAVIDLFIAHKGSWAQIPQRGSRTARCWLASPTITMCFG